MMGATLKKCMQPNQKPAKYIEPTTILNPWMTKNETVTFSTKKTKKTSTQKIQKHPKLKKAEIQEFSNEDIVIIELLGEGGFGKVHRAWNKQSKNFWALKSYNDPNPDCFEGIENEDHLLMNVKKVSDNKETLLNYVGLYQKPKNSTNFIMAMESGEVDLKKLLLVRNYHQQEYSLEECLYIFQSLATDFAYLQSKGIANRDVKTENVILVEQKNQKGSNLYHYKIADYGIGFVLEENQEKISMYEVIGYTKRYAAPELLKANPEIEETMIDYDPFKADCYSLGKTFLEILGINENTLGTYANEELRALIYDMLQENPDIRISFKDVASRLQNIPLKPKQPENEKIFLSGWKKIKEKNATKKNLFDEYYNNFKGYISIGNSERARDNLKEMEFLLENYKKEFKDEDRLNLMKEKCLLTLEYQQNYKEALDLALLYYDECKKLKQNDIHIADSSHLLGKIFCNIKESGNFEKIEYYFQNAIDIYTNIENHIEASRVLLDYAIFYQNIKENFDKAEETFKKALSTLQLAKGPLEKEYANIYMKMACFYQDSKQIFTKAEELFLKALSIQQRIFGDEHPETAATYHFLGCFYTEYINNNGEAESFLLKAIKYRENIFGENNPITAESYHELARFYKNNKVNVKLAEEYYMKTFKIRKEILKEDHPLTADIYNDLAIFYDECKKDYNKAEEYYKKALEIREKFYGETHSCVAESMDALGVFYKNVKKDYVNAQKYYEKALKFKENLFKGEDHTMLARSLVNLGVFYKNCLKDFVQAEIFYQRALQMRLNLFGEENEETAEIYYKMGYFYNKAKIDYDKAEEFYKKALKIRQRLLGPEHRDTAEVYESMGSFYANDKKNIKEADIIYSQFLLCYDNIEEKELLDNLDIFKDIAQFYQKYDEKKALKLYMKILKIQEDNLVANNVEERDIADTFFEIGIFLENSNSLENRKNLAKDYFAKALKIREKHLGKDDPLTIECQSHIK